MEALIGTSDGVKRVKIKLSPTAQRELEEIETKIRGDMTDEQWELFKSIRV